MRLDLFLVNHYHVKSRSQALHLINNHKVLLLGAPLTKASYNVKKEDVGNIKIVEKNRYVGWGAYKLLKAIDYFYIDLKNLIILDIGSSTGGFTQVCVEKGAQLVYALDVGENQLDERLRNHPRICSLERLNIRDATKDHFTQGIPQFFVTDVSFIPLAMVFEVLERLEINEGVALVKPQFEVGELIPHFDGVVKENYFHQLAINKVKQDALRFGFATIDMVESPHNNSKKNKEFLIYVRTLRSS